MKCKMLKSFLSCSLFVFLSISNVAHAGVINSVNGILNDSKANELEVWLDQGDLDWQSLWYGAAGSTSESWHNAVDGAGPTVSIYEITWNGSIYLIGGYTDLDWGKPDGYRYGEGNSFIFNLNTHMKYDFQGVWGGQAKEILADSNQFATFGSGYDLFGGEDILGAKLGYSYDLQYTSGAVNQGQLLGAPWPTSNFVVNKLETFSFSKPVPPVIAQPVSEPTTMVMFVIALVGLLTRRVSK